MSKLPDILLFKPSISKVLKIIFNFCSNMDVKVYFHAENQFLDLSGRLGYKVHVGRRYESQITIQDVKQIEYKNVENGIIFYESDKKCTNEPYDKCMYHTLTTTMEKETDDDCTAPWVLGNTKICTKPHDINRTFWISWNRITNQKRDCHKPCHTTLINVGAKNEQSHSKKGEGKLVLYFPSSVKQSQEHYFITLVKLAGQIGGYIGLFKLSIFLLGLLKFHSLIDGLVEIQKSNEEIEADIEQKYNDSTGDDPLTELSILAINSTSLKVN